MGNLPDGYISYSKSSDVQLEHEWIDYIEDDNGEEQAIEKCSYVTVSYYEDETGVWCEVTGCEGDELTEYEETQFIEYLCDNKDEYFFNDYYD